MLSLKDIAILLLLLSLSLLPQYIITGFWLSCFCQQLSGPPGCPAEILHCFFSERHFWKCRQSI